MHRKLVAIASKPANVKQIHRPRTKAGYKAQLSMLKNIVKDSYAKKLADVKQQNKEKIAMNVAGFYALECGIGILCEQQNKTPLEVLQSIKDKTIDKNDLLLIARFANATWKAGQPFRAIDRIERDTFRPAVLLTEEELAKDFTQIRNATEKLLEKLAETILSDSDLDTQLDQLHVLLKDKQFATEMAEWLDSAYYRETGQEAPQFLAEEQSIEDVLGQIELEAQKTYLKMEFEKLVDIIKEQMSKKGQKLSVSDEKRIRETAHMVMDAHQEQMRKNGIPYFVHQLDVTRTLVEVLKVTDPMAIQLSLLHDTREDQIEDYAEIKQRLEEKVAKLPEGSIARKVSEADLAYLRLGVRMLTKRDEGIDVYMDQLVNPHKFYNKHETQPDSDRYVRYNKVFVELVQHVKMADILANVNDLRSIFEEGNEVREKMKAFPEKTFNKVIHTYIMDFILKADISPKEKHIFFTNLKNMLQEYATDRSPRTEPLRKAAQRALEELDNLR